MIDSLRERVSNLPPALRNRLAQAILSPETVGQVPKSAWDDLRTALGENVEKARRRVVVTGTGAITAVGMNARETWESLKAGRPGIGLVTQFDASAYPSRIAAEVKGFDPSRITSLPAKEVRRLARCSQLTVAAAEEAINDANMSWPLAEGERTGIVIGTGLGGFEMYRQSIGDMVRKGTTRILPHFAIGGLPNMPAFYVSRSFGIKGINNTIVTACAAGTQAVGQAARIIREGVADIMVTGGVEALIIDTFFAGFSAMRAISTRNDAPERSSRPFDADRDGFIIGEGAAIFVLESLAHAKARGATIYAEILGDSATGDAYHIAAPEPEGSGAARAMAGALADAGLTPQDVDYINAHGTSTPLNDSTETLAIKRVFGEHAYSIPVSSTKSMIGHAFGGAGAIEALACISSVREDVIHPTINYETPDPNCDLDYVPNVARKQRVDVARSNSFGLGGQNACLVIGKYKE